MLILVNILQGKELNRVKQLESDITFHIGKQEAELALKVNSAAYHGDLYQLKGLIRTGADPNKSDYDGRSPLVRKCLVCSRSAFSLGFTLFSHHSLRSGVYQIILADLLGTVSLSTSKNINEFFFCFLNSTLQHQEDMKISHFFLFRKE